MMAILLHIDTSDKICSAALSENEKIIAVKAGSGDRAHASMLTVIIDSLLKENKIQASSLDAVSVSKGPGSYTGLRIGVSAAKGICYALNKPLIGINTLYAMAAGLILEGETEIDKSTLLCPMIDARRMEVYNAVYDPDLNEKISTRATIVDENTFSELLRLQQVIFFGSGAVKCKSVIKHPNAVFIDDFYCLASFLAKPAYESFRQQKFENTAYFEPFYLKDFIATAQSKNILK
jgi:tRNA threonylcarbamoyladenosine biosynthesis protein TsaB